MVKCRGLTLNLITPDLIGLPSRACTFQDDGQASNGRHIFLANSVSKKLSAAPDSTNALTETVLSLVFLQVRLADNNNQE